MRIRTANPQGPTQSLPPGAHKLGPLVRCDHPGDPEGPPLVLDHSQRHFGAGEANLLSGMTTGGSEKIHAFLEHNYRGDMGVFDGRL